MSDLEIIRGDDELLRGVITDPEDNDAVVDLTGVTAMQFVIKKSDRATDIEALLAKTLGDGVEITSDIDGEFEVELTHTETALLPAGTFVWALQYVDALGKVNERTRGKITVRRDIIQTVP